MGLDQNFADEVAAYIRSNLDEDLKVEKLASHFLIDSSTLEHLFRLFLHQAVHHFVKEERLLKSRELLENTNGTLYEIIDAIGLSSISSFTQQFKKRFGLTPGEYRKRYRLEASKREKRPNLEKNPENDKQDPAQGA